MHGKVLWGGGGEVRAMVTVEFTHIAQSSSNIVKTSVMDITGYGSVCVLL
jgi:hypothetical protein